MPPVNRERLKQRRDERDLSNKELAELVKISPRYLDNVLCGVDKPSQRLIYRFARELELPVEELEVIEDGKRTPKGDPSEPPVQPPNTPTAPPRRPTSEPTGPRRVESGAVA